MTGDLPVLAYAVAGCDALPFPPTRVLPLPPPGPSGRGARLPDLAVALARLAVGERALPPNTGVQIGTALGCLAETESFVENMICRDGEEPKPRAFTASVHNAIASRVAIALAARGDNRTFSHGELSFVQAAVASLLRAPGNPVLLGGLDEQSAWRKRVAPNCVGEGGAMLLCGQGGPALARITLAWFGRSSPPTTEGCNAVLSVGAPSKDLLRSLAARAVPVGPLCGDHPSACACAVALAIAILAGEIAPAVAGLEERPRTLGIAVTSHLGDTGMLMLQGSP